MIPELHDLSQTRAPKDLDKGDTKKELAKILEELDELQNLLYASSKHAILVVIQGLDAAGKDSLTRHVFGLMNPLGIRVSSFKVPTEVERSHDFLWRIHKELPATGMIRIFNRSHYEDVLAPTVHGTITEAEGQLRMDAINNFEQMLVRHGNTHILKIFLNVSVEEQNERLAERLTNPRKMWKHNDNDKIEMRSRHEYLTTYKRIFRNTGNIVPWHVIPADQKWYRDILVATLFRDMLKNLKMEYPKL